MREGVIQPVQLQNAVPPATIALLFINSKLLPVNTVLALSVVNNQSPINKPLAAPVAIFVQM